MPRDSNATDTTSYASRIAQSKEFKEASQRGIAVEQAKLDLKREVLDIQSRLGKKKNELNHFKSTIPLNVSEIRSIQAVCRALEGELSDLSSLEGELFPSM